MTKSNDFGVGLMHENAITASKVGWEPGDMSNFSKDENLMRLVLGVLHGTHEIKAVEHIIDCDADPLVPSGWKVEEHQKMSNIKFDPSKISFYASQKQKDDGIEGSELRKELEGEKVLNANVLDYLLKNPRIVPKGWKGRYIFFWGTVYRNSDNEFCVRCLFWRDGHWNDGDFGCFDSFYWNRPDYSAILMS